MNALTRSHRLDDARAIARLMLAIAPDECAAGLLAILRLLDAAENSGAEASPAVPTILTK